jgi:hypothetical protein
MQKMNNNENRTPFEEIVKNKLENYTQPVDDALWNDIESRLNTESKAKRMAFIPWISGIAAAACIALIWMLFPVNEKSVGDEMVVQSVVAERAVEISSKKIETIGTVGTRGTREMVEMAEVQGEIEPVIPDGNGKDTEIVPEEKKATPTYKDLYANTEDYAEPIRHRSTQKTNTLGVHFGSGGGLLAMNNADNAPLYSDGMYGGGNKITSNVPDYMADDIFYPENFTDITHYAPISLGISFKKELNTTFALETGLIYTYLGSKYENKNPKRDAVLQLHYVGIPLNLQAKIYTTKSWNFYLSLGTTLEKGLLSHYSQNEYYGNSAINTTCNERIAGLQWSLNGALGVDYQLNRDYSLYFEPKVGYYLDNNQPISARTETPLIIGLNVGVRYTF